MSVGRGSGERYPLGRGRPMKFRPNLSMAGRRLQPSESTEEQPSSTSTRPRTYQPTPVRQRGRGRAQHVVVSTDGLFSEGIATSKRGHSVRGLGRMVVKERLTTELPQEDEKEEAPPMPSAPEDNCAHMDKIIPPILLRPSDTFHNAGDVKSVLLDIFRQSDRESLKDRMIFLKLPKVLPEILQPSRSSLARQNNRKTHVVDLLPKRTTITLEMRRSGNVFLVFTCPNGNTVTLPVNARPVPFPQKVCDIQPPTGASFSGTLTFLGDVQDMLTACVDAKHVYEIHRKTLVDENGPKK